MWETWMPYVRNIVAQWQPRNCIPIVDFLDSWRHIVPMWILDNILDQLIFPKLQKEVRWAFPQAAEGNLGEREKLLPWPRALRFSSGLLPTLALGGELEPSNRHRAHPLVDTPLASPDAGPARAPLLAHPQ